MNKNTVMLKWLLLIGGIYFLSVAVAHMLGVKIPLLFIYFNVPSYEYQNKIISFLSFGWAVFMFAAAYDPMNNHLAVKAILIAGIGAIFGLNIINSSTDFLALAPGIKPSVFQMETLGLSAYVAALIYFYFLSTRQNTNP